MWIKNKPCPKERLTWLRQHLQFDAVIDIGSGDYSDQPTYFLGAVFSDVPHYRYDKNPNFGNHSTIVELGEDLPLDDILSNTLFNNAFYKIDVDGPEIAILNGSTNVLLNTSAIMIEGVLDDGKFLNICNWMRENDWMLIDVIEPIYRKTSMMLIQVDLVFVKESIFRAVEQVCYTESIAQPKDNVEDTKKIAIIVNHSLELLKCVSINEKVTSVLTSTPLIRERVFDRITWDYDVHVQLNYVGELTQFKLDQIEEIKTYPNIRSMTICKQSDIVDSIRQHIDVSDDMAENIYFMRHHIQHYVFFNMICEMKDQYDYFFRLRPDIITLPEFNLEKLLTSQRLNNYQGFKNLFWSCSIHKQPSLMKPLAVRDVMFACDKDFAYKTHQNFTRWLQDGYNQIEQIPMLSTQDYELLNPESWIADLTTLNVSGVYIIPSWGAIINRGLTNDERNTK